MHFTKIYCCLSLLFLPHIIFSQTSLELTKSGIYKAQNKDFAGAIEDYSKAILLDSSQPVVYYNRAISKGRLKDYEGAISDYTKSIQLKNDLDAYYNRGLMKVEVKDYPGALSDFNASFGIKKDKPAFYFLRGDCLYLTNDFIGAISDLNTAIQLKPDYAQAYLIRGFAQLSLKKVNEACLDFNKANTFISAKAADMIKKYCH